MRQILGVGPAEWVISALSLCLLQFCIVRPEAVAEAPSNTLPNPIWLLETSKNSCLNFAVQKVKNSSSMAPLCILAQQFLYAHKPSSAKLTFYNFFRTIYRHCFRKILTPLINSFFRNNGIKFKNFTASCVKLWDYVLTVITYK